MRLGVIFAVLVSALAAPAAAAELRLIAATALKDALEPLVREFEGQSGHKVRLVFSGTVATRDRIRQGEMADVVLIGADALENLIDNGLLQRDGRRDIARSGLGAGQRAGFPVPDISSAEALQRIIRASQSLAFSRGPSGEHVEALMRRLGLADEIGSKTRRPNSGAEVARLVGSGEAEFGIAQVSEFIGIPGVTNLGPLPPSLQAWTIYAAAVHGKTGNREASTKLINHLSGASAERAIRSIGMEPVR
jgi:molybdate transport system substrate-binding protein